MKQHIFIAIFVIIYLKNGGASPAPTKTSNVTLSKHPVVLVVSFDGFRHNYLGKVKTPALDSLIREGVYVPHVDPVFPTMTFPNHHSISTGLYAESHGIVDNEFFDPLFNKTLSGYNDDEGFWNYHPDAYPIWIHNELNGDGRVSGGLMWTASSQPFGRNNDLRPTYYHPVYDSSVPWEDRVQTVISWMTNDTKPANLVFLYYNEPDSKGHAFGPNNNVTLLEIESSDARAAYLIEKLKEADIFDKINLIILSDHGMGAVTQERIVNLTEKIDDSLVAGKYGNTPLVQLIAKEGKIDELYESLSNFGDVPGSGFTVYKKGELGSPYYFASSRRVLDITVLAEPGYAFDDYEDTIKQYNAQYNLKADPKREFGVHGYTNLNEDMRPIFIAHGPAFRKGFNHTSPIRNVDIVPLISRIVGIPEPPNNGSIKNVEAILARNLRMGAGSGSTITAKTNISLIVLSFVSFSVQYFRDIISTL